MGAVEWAGAGAAKYIEHQRDRWESRGSALSTDYRARLSRYFAEEDLARVRIVENARLPIPNPPGYDALRRFSGFAWPNPAEVAAMTFDHVVVAQQPVWESLIFHELVHVTQYRLLGVRRFAEMYVRGFWKTRRYESIPLEACAFALEERFLRGGEALDVSAEVRRHLIANGFTPRA